MRLFFAGLLLSLCFFSCFAGPGLIGRKTAEQYDAAVKILVLCDGEMFGGTGVVIESRKMLTAYHVVECESEATIMVKQPKDKPKVAKLLKYNPIKDIAVLELASDFGDLYSKPVEYGPPPRVGTEICIAHSIPNIGHRCGEVQPYSGFPGNLVHTAITDHGNSGSGVYDKHGRLIGVVTHLTMCSNGQICGGKVSTIWDSRPF